MKILLVEDDIKLSDALTKILQDEGNDVEPVYDGIDGYNLAKEIAYDAIILDVMLPGMDGIGVIEALRREGINTPTLILSAKSAVRDKITGLDSGADDYLTKPFAPSELMAHLRAITRRRGDVVFNKLEFCDIVLDLESLDLSCGEEVIRLRMKEFLIMKALMMEGGNVVSKDALMQDIWGADSETGSLDAHMSFLRKKLRFLDSHTNIETIFKRGYRLVCDKECG